MAVGEPGFSLTESFEGYADEQPDGSCVSYWDSIGCVWTIGHGTTGVDVVKGTHWTRAQADDRCNSDWEKFKQGVLRASPVLVNYPNRLGACVDFAYNEGIGRYQSSTLRSLVNRQDWTAAALEFPKWNLGGGRVIADLVRRRASEQALFRMVDSPQIIVPASPVLAPVQEQELDNSSFPALVSSFAKRLAALIQDRN